jgi:hypothetical protein
MAPLLMFKRNSMTQNRGLANKLDGNTVRNIQVFEKSFSQRNIYSNFSVINSRSPEKEYVVSIAPDYVTVEYTCMIWTHFMEQMDKLIESLNYSSRSYWGDPNKFQFYSSIESFQDNLTFETGQDRLVRNSFTMTLNGYLIPEVMNKSLSVANRTYGVANVVFGLETSTGVETFVANQRKPSSKKLSNIVAADSQNNIVNVSNVAVDALTYINSNKELTGAVNDSITVIFASSWADAPAGLPQTSQDQFTFFCNGQFIEKTAIVSFIQSGGVSTLVINPSQLGFSLSASDEIIAIGKFA